MSKTPTAHEIAAKILNTFRQQIATTRQGKAIAAAGLDTMLAELAECAAASAAYSVLALLPDDGE